MHCKHSVHDLRVLRGFYQNELTNNILSFWLPRCVDGEHGGFFNCFDNSGETLISRDKYTWSQGRFVWLWSKLAAMEGTTFTDAERARFLALAQNGYQFLRAHCLIAPDDDRCVFLMEADGTPKRVPGYDALDMSVYADCFVIVGFARYALAADDPDAWAFALRLYRSAVRRIQSGCFHTLPYPIPPGCRVHGIPMILTHVAAELYTAAKRFDPAAMNMLASELRSHATDILDHFTDADHVLREIITADNKILDNPLGQHINPGHTLEDAWFLLDAAAILCEADWPARIARIAQKAMAIGWDEAYGGIAHFAPAVSGALDRDAGGHEAEPMLKLVRSDRYGKLWWVHSEALYATLRLFDSTGDDAFLAMHRQVAEYTFRVFPNPNRAVREWLQILAREGTPQDKVVALPVKDPYHIARNLILMIELLERMIHRAETPCDSR